MVTQARPQIPLVDYLELGDHPHLVASECTNCHARFFDRRNACGKCGELNFTKVDVPTEGILRSFTIVSFAAPGISVPFVAAIVSCEGTTVSANLVNVTPDPASIDLGMPVHLTTFSIGLDSAGTEAIGFGFEPTATAPSTKE
jgi:uncharacterized OB-fold protein